MQSCGKTTVGAGVKFMYMVSASSKRLHIIAAKTTGIAEKNIIQQENGILDLHRNAVYCGNGDRNNKLPHIKFEGKLIYVLGYDNKDKWENVLGSQFGCVYIDEINTADIDFVREISTRNDYLLATLNPDDPSLPVYREFVNRSRPCARYAADVPEEILRELTEEPVPGWRYWFFSFRDNLSLTEADIQRKMDAAPKGTKLYKNKILGLRGRATGLVFDLQQRHIITAAQAAEHRFLYYSIGCDTSYSRQSHDRLTFEAVGITADKKCILLLEETHNNRDKTNPFAPSDVIPLLNRFAEQVKSRYGFARTIYIDSADAGTIQEAPKPKAAKAKAHTEGVSAGHAVEVAPPATKDNVGYSPEKIGGKSLTSEDSGGIIKEQERMQSSSDYAVPKNLTESREFRSKFDSMDSDKRVQRQYYQVAKEMLQHRSGTNGEDLYFYNTRTKKWYRSITGTQAGTPDYTEEIRRALQESEKGDIVSFHNHPLGMPPSAGDLNAALKNGYKKGYTIGHDGIIFEYTKPEYLIDQSIYDTRISKYKDLGQAEFEAQYNALIDLSKLYGFSVKEVK
ncbi:hypothetical protein [Ruminococcus sp.]|uniref:hypothetical protein n=1 Tax=Ruminococcus sp. TaxID=41978 RepID=UPI003A8E2C08